MQSLKTLFRSKANQVAVATAVLVGPAVAMAADEGSDIPGLITAAGATCALIGAAYLAVHASIKIFSIIRRAF